MDDLSFPIGKIIDTGVNGFFALLVYNLIQQNKRLIADMSKRDGALMELIYKLIDQQD